MTRTIGPSRGRVATLCGRLDCPGTECVPGINPPPPMGAQPAARGRSWVTSTVHHGLTDFVTLGTG